MEPVTAAIAASSVQLAAQHLLVKIANGAAGAAGKAAYEKAAQLYQAIKARFTGNPVTESALSDFTANPEDADLQATLRVQLKKILDADPAFAKKLSDLTGTRVSQETGVVFYNNISGNVETLTNVGTVFGGLNINKARNQ